MFLMTFLISFDENEKVRKIHRAWFMTALALNILQDKIKRILSDGSFFNAHLDYVPED